MMSVPTPEEADRLIAEMYERVDGGSCVSCTTDAMDALAVVWPDVPWRERFDELGAAGWPDRPKMWEPRP